MAKDGTPLQPDDPGESAGIRKGRFRKAMDSEFASFNASISFDQRLYAEDVKGSIAHVRMLARQRIVSPHEAEKIEKGLLEVLSDIEEGRLPFSEELEDIHVNIEEALRAKIGEVAGKLHTARSRNDQIALDLRLYLRDRVRLVMEEAVGVMKALVDKSEACIQMVMPGYTHLQRAQPVRLSHHLMAYVWMLRRDWGRFRDSLERLDEMPLGSAALAGTTFPIDRTVVAKELGFSRVSPNSMDSVSDRDFALEFLFNASMVMMHLSRLAEELILWSSAEFGFCELPDEFCSGSSIMPQKKNPDACELIRGKTGRVYGDLVALLTTMKGLPLAYDKDLQEDKEPVFDAIDTVRGSLRVIAGLIPGTRFHGERMLQAASDSFMAATDMADALVRQGVSFREAHERIGAIMRGLAEGTLEEMEERIPDAERMVEARDHRGGTARRGILDQISEVRSFFDEQQPRKPEAERKGTTKRTE